MTNKKNGQQLKEIREHMQLSQGLFARAIYLSKNALVDLEENGLSDGHLKLIEWYISTNNKQRKKYIQLTEREKYDMIYDTINYKKGIVSYMNKYEDNAKGITENFLYKLWNLLKHCAVDDLFFIKYQNSDMSDINYDDYIRKFAKEIFETEDITEDMIEANKLTSKQHLLLIAFKTGYLKIF